MDLKYKFYVAAQPEEVWNILVSPEGVKKIFFGSVIESTFKVGDPLQYVGPGPDGHRTVHVYGQVLEYEPNKVCSFTHNVGKSYATAAEEKESRISYQLEPFSGGTKLTLIHDQWAEDDPSYETSKEDWWFILSNIKTFAETGKTLKFS